MSAKAVTLSDFLRKPTQVVKKLDRSDVLLVRTGGKPALVLSLQPRVSASNSVHEMGMKLAADAISAVPEGRGRSELLVRRFPWVRFLPQGDRPLFERAFVETLLACASLDNFVKLEELLSDWKATALVHADPSLTAELGRPVPASAPEIPVRRPQAARAAKR
jgi:hypothetical protein